MAEIGSAIQASNLLLTAVTKLSGVLNAIHAADVAEQWQPLQLQQLAGRVAWLKSSVLERPLVSNLGLPLHTLPDTLRRCTEALEACTLDAAQDKAQLAAVSASKKQGWLRRKAAAVKVVISGSENAMQLAALCQAIQTEVDSITSAAALEKVVHPLILAGGDHVPVPAARGYIRDTEKFDEVRACIRHTFRPLPERRLTVGQVFYHGRDSEPGPLCYAMLCYAMLCYAMLCYAGDGPPRRAHC